MSWLKGILFVLATYGAANGYKIGVGRADMTGPTAEVAFMGYAKPEQRGTGLHLRQFARTFIIDDGENRLVFVSCDMGMMGTGVRKQVLEGLKDIYGNLYNEQNVMLSGTHSHSTPGGFLLDIIFDLNSFGFVRETFNAYVNGVFRSITRAHDSMMEGRIFMSRGEILNANINRSPTSYLNNPEEERKKYQYDVDKTFTQLKFKTPDGTPIGVLHWFAVHATSMNNTNTLVSSDNVGYASLMFEKKINGPDQGPFVAAFASTNLGDVSPNIAGPRCVPSGDKCNALTSSCVNPADKCIAFGPGENMMESTNIIAHRILEKAWDSWKGSSNEEEITGPISTVHQYVDMPSQRFNLTDPFTGENIQVKGCLPAMGYSFAAGTTDGPGAFSFQQGTKTTNPMWNLVTDFLAPPSQEMIDCQAPKPILLSTGEINFPFEWQPSVVSTHLGLLGNRGLAIACVPGEFTTMSGRRMREALKDALGLESTSKVVIAGLCNTYSDYITTPQEYQVQRYEGASTIFGPHTLTIYLEQYKKLAKYILENTVPDPGPQPRVEFNRLISLLPGVIFDYPGWKRSFGEVIYEPQNYVAPGETVRATFVGANPRNNLMQESTFLKVEQLIEGNDWKVVATDIDWETQFLWKRKSTLFGTSEVEIRWTVPEDWKNTGVYRIRHTGYHKKIFGGVLRYEGVTKNFNVTS